MHLAPVHTDSAGCTAGHGNPALNPKLWDLYKAIATGEDKTEVEKSNARAP